MSSQQPGQQRRRVRIVEPPDHYSKRRRERLYRRARNILRGDKAKWLLSLFMAFFACHVFTRQDDGLQASSSRVLRQHHDRQNDSILGQSTEPLSMIDKEMDRRKAAGVAHIVGAPGADSFGSSAFDGPRSASPPSPSWTSPSGIASISDFIAHIILSPIYQLVVFLLTIIVYILFPLAAIKDLASFLVRLVVIAPIRLLCNIFFVYPFTATVNTLLWIWDPVGKWTIAALLLGVCLGVGTAWTAKTLEGLISHGISWAADRIRAKMQGRWIGVVWGVRPPQNKPLKSIMLQPLSLPPCAPDLTRRSLKQITKLNSLPTTPTKEKSVREVIASDNHRHSNVSSSCPVKSVDEDLPELGASTLALKASNGPKNSSGSVSKHARNSSPPKVQKRMRFDDKPTLILGSTDQAPKSLRPNNLSDLQNGSETKSAKNLKIESRDEHSSKGALVLKATPPSLVPSKIAPLPTNSATDKLDTERLPSKSVKSWRWDGSRWSPRALITSLVPLLDNEMNQLDHKSPSLSCGTASEASASPLSLLHSGTVTPVSPLRQHPPPPPYSESFSGSLVARLRDEMGKNDRL